MAEEIARYGPLINTVETAASYHMHRPSPNRMIAYGTSSFAAEQLRQADGRTADQLHPLVRRAVYFAMRDKNPGAFALTD